MRLSHVMLSQGFGGAERYFVDLCTALAKRGHAVQAVCQRGSMAHDRIGRVPGIQIAPIRVMGAWDPLARGAIRRALRRFGPELVHVHLARGAWLGGQAAHRLGLPVVTKLHNYVKLKYYRHVDWFNVTTESQRDYLLGHGVVGERIRVIPNFSSLPPVAASPATNREAVNWVSYGRLVHKKGFDLLLRAFSRLRETRPDARLCIGGDGEEGPRLQTLSRELGLEGHVDFPGWISDVSGLLDGADVFVLASRDEPFGIVVLEAMARGIPIVSTRTQGPLEILDEMTAWLCDPDDADGLARTMLAAADSVEQRCARAGQALVRYRDTYHEDVVMPKLIALYERIIGTTPGPCRM
jgi:glycosyltransferase involved in cell wall biosynthesis